MSNISDKEKLTERPALNNGTQSASSTRQGQRFDLPPQTVVAGRFKLVERCSWDDRMGAAYFAVDPHGTQLVLKLKDMSNNLSKLYEGNKVDYERMYDELKDTRCGAVRLAERQRPRRRLSATRSNNNRIQNAH
jgi:hypothetical protein